MSAALGSVPAATAGAAGTQVVLGVSAMCMTLALLVSRGLPDVRPRSASDPGETAERSR